MDGQKPCVDCLHAIKIAGSTLRGCNIDKQLVKVGLIACDRFISKKDLHERAESFRKMINSLSDEQIAFMYL